MSRLPRLIAELACASRGLSAFGAALAEHEDRLARIDALEATRLEVPEAWSDLLGDVEIATDQLRVDPSSPNDAPVEDGSPSNQGRAEAVPVLRRAAVAPPSPYPTHREVVGGADPGAPVKSDRAPTRAKSVGQKPSDLTTQQSPKASAPQTQDPFAAIGTSQVVRTKPDNGSMGTAAAPSLAPQTYAPALHAPTPHFSAQETRMDALLNRIQGTRRPPATPGHTQTPPQGIGAAPTVSSPTTAMTVPQTAPRPDLQTASVSAAPAEARGLSRLLARGRALGIASPSAPSPSAEAEPGTSGVRNAAQAALRSQGAAPTPTSTDLRGPTPAQNVASAMGSGTNPSPFAPTPPASPLSQDRLARDLADLLRREARAAGIDLDGGAP